MARIKEPTFASLGDMVKEAADVIRPPERTTVSQAAEKYRHINNPGNYVGPYQNKLTPYNVEFQDVLTSHDFTGAVFVGPAQAGKTEPCLNYVTYSVMCDPADFTIVGPTSIAVRDFSKRRLQKLYRETTALQSKFIHGKKNTNVYDTQFASGMLLTLSHPSAGELSGKPIPRLWITDYDRIPSNIDGEGNAFDLASKRATTFGRFGMCVAESSPGFVVTNPKWVRTSRHEAEPTEGVLALYNRGDRRRWYWECPHCAGKFEPSFSLLKCPEFGDDMDRAEETYMECPHCAGRIEHSMKDKLNLGGRWIKDGQRWEKDGTVTGTAIRSDIASFWLKGPAAKFTSWRNLMFKFLKATDEYERTGSEEALKATVNTDQGEPYVPKALLTERLPDELKARAEDYGTAEQPVVPDGVRFLTATIDVQAGLRPAFVVHVFGHGVGGDVWHIDMFKIRKSERVDADGDHEFLDPAAYPEDWDILVPKVLERTYPLNDKSGRHMQIKLVGCDSGGKEGVTTNAYNFWRRLRDAGVHAARFQLLKGEPSKTAPRYKVSYPDSQRKDRKAGARGDVPVGFINSNLQKDTAYAMLGREDAGGGMVHFPKWAEDWLYMQLTSEIRTPKGWENTSSKRNEAFDLLYYALSLNLDRRIQAEMIDWEKPPGWAELWDANDLVIDGPDEVGFVRQKRTGRFKSLGADLM